MFAFMPYRIQSIMENTVLMAVPLFVFMGLVLQKTKLAEQLLESMGRLFGGVRGGIAISTVLVGALLALGTHFALLSVSDKISNFLTNLIDDKEKTELIGLDYYYSAIPLHPHNNALQIWLELGLVGIFLYVVLIISLWKRIIFKKNITKFKAALLSGTTCSPLATKAASCWRFRIGK